jgi:hypothetical protein
MVNLSDNIRASSKGKTSRYGELSIPYILALNVLDFAFDAEDIAEALFGDETVTYNFETGEGFPGRKPNGVWFGPEGFQNRRMSGVCVFRYLIPDKVGDVEPVLWHHPRANQPLPPDLWPLSQQNPNDEIGQLVEGQSAVDLLDIDIGRMS